MRVKQYRQIFWSIHQTVHLLDCKLPVTDRSTHRHTTGANFIPSTVDAEGNKLTNNTTTHVKIVESWQTDQHTNGRTLKWTLYATKSQSPEWATVSCYNHFVLCYSSLLFTFKLIWVSDHSDPNQSARQITMISSQFTIWSQVTLEALNIDNLQPFFLLIRVCLDLKYSEYMTWN